MNKDIKVMVEFDDNKLSRRFEKFDDAFYDWIAKVSILQENKDLKLGIGFLSDGSPEPEPEETELETEPKKEKE
jgi:hypothetical protein